MGRVLLPQAHWGAGRPEWGDSRSGARGREGGEGPKGSLETTLAAWKPKTLGFMRAPMAGAPWCQELCECRGM